MKRHNEKSQKRAYRRNTEEVISECFSKPSKDTNLLIEKTCLISKRDK